MTSPIPSEPRTQPTLYHAPILPAVWIAVCGILTIYVVQLALAPAVGGLAAAAIGFAVTAIAMVVASRALGLDLGVRRARPRFFLAAVLIGISCWYLELELVLLLRPPGDTARLEHLIEAAPLPTSLLVLAVLPAIGEELVFRGLLARALARSHALLAIVVSALVFSAYHLVPAQMLGTFPLGLALGLLAVRSGSIVPCMVAHLVNNMIVLVIQRVAITDHHPDATLAAAGLLFAGGVALAARGAPA